MNINESYKSPDKQHKVEFFFAGEIKFGPEYFTVAVNGFQFKNKLFGRKFKWDSNSKYLALQEWLTSDYQKGPITALLIVELNSLKFARVSIAEKGFIEPIQFEIDTVIYRKDFAGTGISKEYEINLKEVDDWVPLL